jgi:NitT/TauT family transport system ATP-binding protein
VSRVPSTPNPKEDEPVPNAPEAAPSRPPDATGVARPHDATGPADVVIRAERLCKTYRVRQLEAVALRDADLEVRQGEFVSLIGPSGCGKTTLLRLVADLIEPTAGTLEVAGTTPREARAARAYGYVFQAPVLYDWRTVLRNVTLPLEIMGYPRGERRRRATELLTMVGLENFQRQYPWQLSGGMQQRVSIARALAFDPKLLLMDEPFGALDEITREAMNLELLRIWRQTGKTVVFVTHSIAEAVFLSSRIVVMTARPGRIREIIDVDLPYPRDAQARESERFFELTTQVREALRVGQDGGGEPSAHAAAGSRSP